MVGLLRGTGRYEQLAWLENRRVRHSERFQHLLRAQARTHCTACSCNAQRNTPPDFEVAAKVRSSTKLWARYQQKPNSRPLWGF